MTRRVAQDKIDALYGKDLAGTASDDSAREEAKSRAGEEEEEHMQVDGADIVQEKEEKEKYFVATIIVAVVEAEGETGADGIAPVPPTPQALEDLQVKSVSKLDAVPVAGCNPSRQRLALSCSCALMPDALLMLRQ